MSNLPHSLKHTSGPWVAKERSPVLYGVQIADRNGRSIAHVESWEGNAEKESAANAVLIASAPDLLDHLRAINSMTQEVFANWEKGDTVNAIRGLERISQTAEIAVAQATR
jgi:hypothetical protein